MLALPSRSHANCSPLPRISNGATKNDLRGSTPRGAPSGRIHMNAPAVTASTTAATAARRRDDHPDIRPTGTAGETTVDWLVRTGAAAETLSGVAPSSARAQSSAVAHRSAGCLLRPGAIGAETSTGSSGRRWASGGGASVSCLVRTAIGEEPVNGADPANISYPTRPSE